MMDLDSRYTGRLENWRQQYFTRKKTDHVRPRAAMGQGFSVKTVILAGGLGTGLTEETSLRPKPMVKIGGRPIFRHVMSICAARGFEDFVVACGYTGEVARGHALIVESPSFAALAYAIGRVLHDPELRARLRPSGRARWASLRWGEITREILGVVRASHATRNGWETVTS